MERNRRFSATINKDVVAGKDNAKELVREELERRYNDIAYCIIGEEDAPTTGKHHLHVYIEFDNQKSCTQLKRVLFNAHVEVYTSLDNGRAGIEYVRKDDESPLEWGKRKSAKRFESESTTSAPKGEANGYEACVNALFGGASLATLCQTYPYVALKHYNALRAMFYDFHNEIVAKLDANGGQLDENGRVLESDEDTRE